MPSRKLAMAVAVMAFMLSGLSFARDGAWSKAGRARESIVRAGGRVTAHDLMAGGGFGSARSYTVDFSRSGLADDQLTALVPSLRDLGGIRLLSLRETGISDRGLLSLATLDRLYAVDVTRAKVTQASIAKLRVRGVYPNVIDNSGPRAFDHHACKDLLFSPDGKLLAVVSHERTDVWDTETKERVAELPVAGGVTFSADGKLLAIADVQGVQVWNLATRGRQLTLPLRMQSPGGAAFSADGRFIYVSEIVAHQYDLTNGAYVGTHPGLLLGRSRNIAGLDLGSQVAAMFHPERGAVSGKLEGVFEQLRLGVVSADGQRVAWMSDPALNGVADGKIRVVDLATGAVIRQLTPPPGLYLGGGFDSADKLLAVGGTATGRSDGKVLVYEVATGRVLLEMDDPAGLAVHVALSDDGRKVAAAFECGSVKWWPVPADQP